MMSERDPRRRRSSSPPPASPMENDDTLGEILLRLPPLPSSLIRASAVCKRWHGVASEPRFLRRYADHHHRNPPLLGFFFTERIDGGISFYPTLDPPNRIPPSRFSLPLQLQEASPFFQDASPFFLEPPRPPWPQFIAGNWRNHVARDRRSFHGCRHGLAVALNHSKREAIVFSPITGEERRVTFPAATDSAFDGAVVCATTAGHGGGHLSSLGSFKLALVCVSNVDGLQRPFVCLYQSEADMWGEIQWIPETVDSRDVLCWWRKHVKVPASILVGNALCWLFYVTILVFDLGTHSMDVIKKPVGTRCSTDQAFQLMRTEDDRLGLAVVSEFTNIQLWERRAGSDGVMGWVLQKTVELDTLLSMEPSMTVRETRICGFAEDSNVIFLWTGAGAFMIHLDSKKFREIPETYKLTPYYPYTGFFSAGSQIGFGGDVADMSNRA